MLEILKKLSPTDPILIDDLTAQKKLVEEWIEEESANRPDGINSRELSDTDLINTGSSDRSIFDDVDQ